MNNTVMNNTANINLCNGLGDKLLDLMGFFVLCKYLNYKPNVTFHNEGNFAWGTNNYDMRLFDFKYITFATDACDFYVSSPNPSSSLCPYKLYNYIKPLLPESESELSFEQVSCDFVLCSRDVIRPSSVILSKIPSDIGGAYGIHLRKSDKVNNHGDNRHENSVNEFEMITTKLLEDVQRIINAEDDAQFLIVSEDDVWKQEITNIIVDISHKSNKPIQIVNIDYTTEQMYCNYKSVLDMFCLSKCKEILQGVKYSTFSIVASLLGNCKLRNYSNCTDSYESCLIHTWSSVIELNNQRNMDTELHKRVTNGVIGISTNINKAFR